LTSIYLMVKVSTSNYSTSNKEAAVLYDAETRTAIARDHAELLRASYNPRRPAVRALVRGRTVAPRRKFFSPPARSITWTRAAQ
jgi:hypothetical protein